MSRDVFGGVTRPDGLAEGIAAKGSRSWKIWSTASIFRGAREGREMRTTGAREAGGAGSDGTGRILEDAKFSFASLTTSVMEYLESEMIFGARFSILTFNVTHPE